MKNLLKILGACFVFSLLLVACQKTITPKLINGGPQLVIQGAVNDTTGPYYVNITKTTDFYTTNIFPTVSGATVTIADVTAGITDVLTETTPGRYATHTIMGTPGNTYRLTVSLNGQTYTAQSTMPQPVKIDSVGMDYHDNTDLTPTVSFHDPAGAVNYYKLDAKRDGVYTHQFQTEDDQLTNGKYFHTHVDQDTGAIKHGDLVTVELIGIDHPVYKFFYDAQQVAFNNSNLASPATPASNINGGCLGYFSAQTVSTKSIVVK